MDNAAPAWRVEEACLNAWPALRQALFGGWLLRFSGGLTRRANSANPLVAAHADAAGLIAACETLYRLHRQPAIFRLPSLIDPAIDAELAARGYASEGLSLVLCGAVAALRPARAAAVRLLQHPTADWFAAMAQLQGHSRRQAMLYRRIVRALAVPAAFAWLVDDSGTGALAFAAIHDGVVCYESVVTDPRRRRQGCARRVVASLAAWAVEQGAGTACLEVEAANAAALALYSGLGFSEIYHYHYRREPTASARVGRRRALGTGH